MISKEQAARLRKCQAHPMYRRRNLRAEAFIFTSQKALHGFICMLEDEIWRRPR